MLEVVGAKSRLVSGRLQVEIDLKGDLPGHPFRGNQYSGGVGDRPALEEEELEAAQKLGLPTTYSGTHDRFAAKGRGMAVDNPLPRATNGVEFKDVLNLSESFFELGKTEEMPISELKTVQDFVRPIAIERIVDGSLSTRPIIVTVGGERVIVNGNHSVVAAKIMGKDVVKVHHIGEMSLEDLREYQK